MNNLTEKAKQALAQIIDPELQFSIIDLGLVYDLSYEAGSQTMTVTMTLTSITCPQQSFFEDAIPKALLALPEIKNVQLQITFDPPWSGEKALPHVQEYFVLRGIPLTRW